MPLKQLCSDPVQLAQYRSPTVCPQRGQVWRGLRNDLLGASEAAQATGVCPYGKTPGDLIAAKCSRAVAQPTAARHQDIYDKVERAHGRNMCAQQSPISQPCTATALHIIAPKHWARTMLTLYTTYIDGCVLACFGVCLASACWAVWMASCILRVC